MVFFKSSSGTTKAEAANVKHISTFDVCEDVRNFSQHSYNVRGPLSLVSTTEELLGSNSSGSGLESREYGRRDFFLLCSISVLASG
jgi:hypothetical protein